MPDTYTYRFQPALQHTQSAPEWLACTKKDDKVGLIKQPKRTLFNKLYFVYYAQELP